VRDSGTADVDDAAGSACEPGKEIIFEDGEFASGWADEKASGKETTGYRVERRTSEGDPGAFLYVAHTVVENTGIWVAHEKAEATYDPATAGAIASIRFSIGGKAIAMRQASLRLLVVQDGKRYWTSALFLINESQDWVRSPEWTDDDLVLFPGRAGSSAGPDLTTTGKRLTFGFMSGASHTTGVSSVTREAGIDNWRVVICKQ
jgi:hypothetical protein